MIQLVGSPSTRRLGSSFNPSITAIFYAIFALAGCGVLTPHVPELDRQHGIWRGVPRRTSLVTHDGRRYDAVEFVLNHSRNANLNSMLMRSSPILVNSKWVPITMDEVDLGNENTIYGTIRLSYIRRPGPEYERSGFGDVSTLLTRPNAADHGLSIHLEVEPIPRERSYWSKANY